MVDDAEKIKEFLHSGKYVATARDVVDRTGKRLCVDLHDAEVACCGTCLRAGKVSIAEIDALLANDVESIKNFCIRMIQTEKLRETGQEYNPSEPPEIEEENETYIGHSQTFLLTFSVIFIIMRERRAELSSYLKTMRQPHAAKYRRGIEAVFAES